MAVVNHGAPFRPERSSQPYTAFSNETGLNWLNASGGVLSRRIGVRIPLTDTSAVAVVTFPATSLMRPVITWLAPSVATCTGGSIHSLPDAAGESVPIDPGLHAPVSGSGSRAL